MRVDQYAFVPANGGVLTVDGGLPHVDDDWELATLQAILPPTRFLRVAAHVEVAPEHVLRLRTFERVDAPGGEPHVPEPLRPAFERALAEANGAPAPPRRPAWSVPGFHEQVEAWAGMELEVVRSWPLSYVARSGDVYFKAVFPWFRHEPAITAALGTPRVLRADRERGWMLMEAVHGEPGGDPHASLRAIAAVHREWASRVEEALALGVPDRRGGASELPYTLVHGDFHPGNVLGETIIDWSDAAIANPLHDVNHLAMQVDGALRDELIATYAEAWPEQDVVAAAAACEAESYEYIAESYRAITAALADDDKWWFGKAEPEWRRWASDVRAGRRPSRDR